MRRDKVDRQTAQPAQETKLPQETGCGNTRSDETGRKIASAHKTPNAQLRAAIERARMTAENGKARFKTAEQLFEALDAEIQN